MRWNAQVGSIIPFHRDGSFVQSNDSGGDIKSSVSFYTTVGVLASGAVFLAAGLSLAINVLMIWLIAGCIYYAIHDARDALCIFAFAVPLEQAFFAWGDGRYNTLTYLVFAILIIWQIRGGERIRKISVVDMALLLWIGWRSLAVLWSPVSIVAGIADMITLFGGVAVVYGYSRLLTWELLAKSGRFFLAGAFIMTSLVLRDYETTGMAWAGTRYELSMLAGNTGVSGPRVARLAAVSIIVTIIVAKLDKRGWVQAILKLSYFVFGIAILLTLNRTTMFALTAAISVWVLIDGNLSVTVKRAVLSVMIGLVIWNLAWAINPEAMEIRFSTTVDTYSSGNIDGLTSGRTVIWGDALDIFWSHPVVGVGTGGFSQAFAQSSSLGEEYGAHSLYIEELVEGGLVGIFVLIFVICSFGVAAWRGGGWKGVAIAIWVLFSITMVSQSLGRSKESWFTLAIVLFFAREYALSQWRARYELAWFRCH